MKTTLLTNFQDISIKIVASRLLIRFFNNMSYLGWKARSNELKIEKPCEHSSVHSPYPNIIEIGLKSCFLWILDQVWIWVTWGETLGHTAQIWTCEHSSGNIFPQSSSNLIRMLFLVSVSLKMGHLGWKTRSQKLAQVSLNIYKNYIILCI
jgi:hypothetical protein